MSERAAGEDRTLQGQERKIMKARGTDMMFLRRETVRGFELRERVL